MSSPLRGMSFIDAIVGTAMVLIVFLIFFGLLRASLLVSSVAKAKASATAIATSQMEYLRSLEYDTIGTVGGIPAGIVPQYATTTQNNIEYVTRTFIQYVDDSADGTGGSDSNGIITDYKRAKVSTTFTIRDIEREVAFVSNIAPPGIETTAGGGTLRIQVVNAVGSAVAGASVRVVNATTSPTVDVTTFSDASGTVLFGGAATSTEYEVYVSKDGYSSAETYERDATNANPNPGFLTVQGNQTTTGAFAIDLLGDLTISTFSPGATDSFFDTFADASQIDTLTNTVVSAGAVILGSDMSGYLANGSALATTTAPNNLGEWNTVEADLDVPVGTTVVVQVTDGGGTPIGDVDLPGNSAGFATFPVDLSALSTTSYPTLRLRALLTSTDPLATPSIESWELFYETVPAPLPDVPFTLTGTKTIGSTSGGAPIYKTVVGTTTDATGTRTISLEWDLYTLVLDTHTLVEEDPPGPYELLPGTTVSGELVVE